MGIRPLVLSRDSKRQARPDPWRRGEERAGTSALPESARRELGGIRPPLAVAFAQCRARRRPPESRRPSGPVGGRCIGTAGSSTPSRTPCYRRGVGLRARREFGPGGRCRGPGSLRKAAARPAAEWARRRSKRGLDEPRAGGGTDPSRRRSPLRARGCREGGLCSGAVWFSGYGLGRRPAVAGIIGGRRAWTVSMISALSIPWR
jgi:hypothetical protein